MAHENPPGWQRHVKAEYVMPQHAACPYWQLNEPLQEVPSCGCWGGHDVLVGSPWQMGSYPVPSGLHFTTQSPPAGHQDPGTHGGENGKWQLPSPPLPPCPELASLVFPPPVRSPHPTTTTRRMADARRERGTSIVLVICPTGSGRIGLRGCRCGPWDRRSSGTRRAGLKWQR
jgi:hypothetical protein